MVRNYKPLIWSLAIVINGLIAFVLFFPHQQDHQYNLSWLPALEALMNGCTFILLLLALFAIKQKNIVRHRNLIWGAFLCTLIFLAAYLIYHYTTPSTRFGGKGVIRYVYFFLLITHIILAVVIIPLALVSISRGLNMQVELHKRITRWSMPIWLYVSATGVIVYLLISPYY